MKLQLENRHILEKNDIESRWILIIEMGDLVVCTQTKDKDRHSALV